MMRQVPADLFHLRLQNVIVLDEVTGSQPTSQYFHGDLVSGLGIECMSQDGGNSITVYGRPRVEVISSEEASRNSEECRVV